MMVLRSDPNDAMKEINAEVNLYMWEIGDPINAQHTMAS